MCVNLLENGLVVINEDCYFFIDMEHIFQRKQQADSIYLLFSVFQELLAKKPGKDNYPSTAVSYKITRDEELVNEKLMQEAQLKSEVDTFPLLKSSAGEKCVNLISMGYYMIPVFESQHIKKSHFLKRILRLPVQTVANEKAENALPKFEQIIDF